VILCPKCNTPSALRRGTGPTPLVGVWESDVAGQISALCREWERMLASDVRPVGCSINFWVLMTGLCSWLASFHGLG
jgi:hypothetical protein